MKIVSPQPRKSSSVVTLTISFFLFSIMIMLLIFYLLDNVWFNGFNFIIGLTFIFSTLILFLIYLTRKLFYPCEIEITENEILRKNLKNDQTKIFKWTQITRFKTGETQNGSGKKDYIWVFFNKGERILIENSFNDLQYTENFNSFKAEFTNILKKRFPDAFLS